MEDHAFAPTTVQLTILGLLDGGYTDRAIAGRLRVSERTVRAQIRILMSAAGKLGRFALGAEAARRGWLDKARSCRERAPVERPARDTDAHVAR